MKRLIFTACCTIFIFISLTSASAQRGMREQQRLPQRQRENVLYLDEAQEKEALAYIRRIYPDRADRLERVRTNRPEMYRMWLSRAFREMRFLDDVKDKDPEHYKRVLHEKELEKESRALAVKHKNTASESEKEQLKIELQNILVQIFEIRQMNRSVEIERLKARLADLNENNKKRIENKEEIIKRRMNEILKENKELQW